MLKNNYWPIARICLVSISGVILFILFLEFIFFRFIFPVPNYPYPRHTIESSDDVVRYDQSNMNFSRGVYRKGFLSEIKASYRINTEGWNSSKEYFEQKNGKKRIAIIGDSYVDALEVDYNKSFAEILEYDLKTDVNRNVEVYRFGIAYASLSQYLQMMRYVKEKYHPDIYIIAIVHNDFLESIYGYDNVYGDFLQFKQQGDLWVEIPPRPHKYGVRLLMRSAIVRFFYFNPSLIRVKQVLHRKFRKERLEMNIGVEEVIKNLKLIDNFCYHIFLCFKRVAGAEAKILFLIDGDRLAIYSGDNPKLSDVYRLNLIVHNVTSQLSMPLIDLTDIFYEDYKVNKHLFNFKSDNHWNEYGHFVVSKAISLFIRNSERLSLR